MLSSVVFASIIVSGNKFVLVICHDFFLHISCYNEYLTESLYAFMFNKTFVIVTVIVIVRDDNVNSDIRITKFRKQNNCWMQTRRELTHQSVNKRVLLTLYI